MRRRLDGIFVVVIGFVLVGLACGGEGLGPTPGDSLPDTPTQDVPRTLPDSPEQPAGDGSFDVTEVLPDVPRPVNQAEEVGQDISARPDTADVAPDGDDDVADLPHPTDVTIPDVTDMADSPSPDIPDVADSTPPDTQDAADSMSPDMLDVADSTPPPPTGPVFGWGGYINTMEEVVPLLDDLAAGGWTAVRYWARPVWRYGSNPHECDLDVLDHLVAEAATRGIVVYVDCEHNYPPSDYITGYMDEWLADLLMLGNRYADEPHVVLECVNEYTGDDQPDLYNQAIAALRADDIHLPLLFNFWWNQSNVALDDPEDNYAVGRHLYGTSYGDYDPPTPMILADAVADSGIVNSMYRYFDDPNESMYLQRVLDVGIPNGWVITELGPTDDESMVSDPSVGNVAYAMQFLREAAAHDVSVVCYRVGEYSNKALYEARALEYFAEPYFTAP